MSLIELPRHKGDPRTFMEPDPDLEARLKRALEALGDLPIEFRGLPGFSDFADSLIELLDELEANDENCEPDEDADSEEERLDLFTFAGITDPPER
ncbi:MAG: hypothetical protein EKK29_21880 [Hyphomicrobiales bacterium]|nr:MAG: hypothetical protein EKK29_21880 [Hyphomicrobiales bacterium]